MKIGIESNDDNHEFHYDTRRNDKNSYSVWRTTGIIVVTTTIIGIENKCDTIYYDFTTIPVVTTINRNKNWKGDDEIVITPTKIGIESREPVDEFLTRSMKIRRMSRFSKNRYDMLRFVPI